MRQRILLRIVNLEVKTGRWHVETVSQKTWAGRFSILSPWFSDILGAVKRDCKSEHLRLDPIFVRQHFGGVPLHRITFEEMRAVYLQQILAGHDQLAEFITNRWLFRHMELYRFFEESLQKIAVDFEKITELSPEQSEALLSDGCEKFGAEKVFCFAVLNDVALANDSFERLQRQSLEKLALRQEENGELTEQGTAEMLRQEMGRLKERQERKIQELTKKHQQEIKRLQAEILALKETVSKGNNSRKPVAV